MAHILYNAWDSLYKEPFGAVKIGHEVVWRIQIFPDENEEIHYVNLILTKDGEEDVPYALENLNHDGLYQVKLQIILKLKLAMVDHTWKNVKVVWLNK